MSLYDVCMSKAKMPARYVMKNEIQLKAGDEETAQQLRDIYADTAGWVKSGKNLFIWSNYTGNGKTSIACNIMKDYFKNDDFYGSGIFVDVTYLISLKKLAITDKKAADLVGEYEYAISTAKLAIFDDIPHRELTDFEQDCLYVWINYRTSNLMSNIYTSNADPEFLKTILKAKTCSRMLDYSTIVHINSIFNERKN